MGNAIYLAVYYQVVKNALPFQSGIDVLPFIVTVAISSVLNGLFLRFLRIAKIPLVLCGVTSLLGSGLLLLLDEDTSFGPRFGISVVNGIAAGISFQATLIAAQLNAPKDIQGSLITITIFNNFFKSVGGVVAIVLGQLILQTTASSEITKYRETLTSSSQEHQILSSIPVEAITSDPQIIYKLPKSLRAPLIHAYVKSFHNIYYFMIGVSAVLLVLTVFATNKKLPKDKDVATKGDPDEKEEVDIISTNESNDTQTLKLMKKNNAK
jgi:hypothetical protein